MTRPANLKAEHRNLLARLTAACFNSAQLTACVGKFAQPPKPTPRDDDTLDLWIVQVRVAGLPRLRTFTLGLERDRNALIAALTLPYSNALTEGREHQDQAPANLIGDAYTATTSHIMGRDLVNSGKTANGKPPGALQTSDQTASPCSPSRGGAPYTGP